MLEPHLSKLSNKSVGESSQITSPPQPRYVLTSMLWNLRQATPNRMASFYRPLSFVPSEKLTGADRLLLAFDALAISHTMGKTPANGKIIHASKHTAAVIPGILASNIKSVSYQLVPNWLRIVLSPK